MSFKPKKFDNVAPSGEFKVPDEGWQDVTITEIKTDTTKSKGQPMLVLTLTIDNGEDAGYSWKEYCVLAPDTDYGWGRLRAICDATGHQWSDDAETIQQFALQFPEGKLRMAVDVEHRYAVKGWVDQNSRYAWENLRPEKTDECIYHMWVDVQPSTYEEWEGEQKNKNAQTRDTLAFSEVYKPAENERTLAVDQDDAQERFEQDAGNGEQASTEELPF